MHERRDHEWEERHSSVLPLMSSSLLHKYRTAELAHDTYTDAFAAYNCGGSTAGWLSTRKLLSADGALRSPRASPPKALPPIKAGSTAIAFPPPPLPAGLRSAARAGVGAWQFVG